MRPMQKGTDKHSHQHISSIPVAWLQSPPITPCRGCAPCHLHGALWERSGEGRGVQHQKPLLQIHHRWEPPVEEESEGATTTCSTIPLEVIQAPVSWRAQERSLT